ncbi:transcription factor upbeat1 [Nicotiana attenuata]|uniref:Transcription factor upbeat1 n=1 Tax=Nicotiana attenuata TaxID=49451 RepID=A0A314KL77_NICAT|nr:transcription factor upbeat1 [Nicotiana attenuata]
MRKERCRNILMKRRVRVECYCRRSSNYDIERKVRILHKLIPNCESSMGLERLFRETADYVLALEMRVKVMQILVNELSA